MRKKVMGMVFTVAVAVTAGVFGFSKMSVHAGDGLRVDSFTVSQASAKAGDLVSLNVEANGGNAPYEYEFTSFNKTTGEQSVFGSYSEDKFITYYCAKSGDVDFKVNVKDADGNVTTQTMTDFNIDGLKITSLTADVATPQMVGSKITFKCTTENELAYRYGVCNYTFTNKDTNQSETISEGKQATWTPNVEGNYTVTVYVKDYLGQEATKSTDFTVSGVSSANIATVYYKAPEGKSAFIHFQIGNGEWTSYYGRQMNECKTDDGYNYVYKVDLGSESNLNVCFHDGNGNWDSKYGENYHLTAGTSYIADGNINR